MELSRVGVAIKGDGSAARLAVRRLKVLSMGDGDRQRDERSSQGLE